MNQRPERPSATLQNPRRALLFLMGLPLVGLLVAGLSLAAGVSGESLTILALAICTAMLAAIPLAVDQGRAPADRHIFMSLLAMVYMIHYVVPALTLYMHQKGAIDAPGMAHSALLPRDVIDGQLVALTGVASMLIAYASPLGRAAARVIPRPKRDWSAGANLLVAFGITGLGWLILIASMAGLVPAELGTGWFGALGSYYFYGNTFLVIAILRHNMRFLIPITALNVVAAAVIGIASSRKIEVLIAPTVVYMTALLITKKYRAPLLVMGFAGLVVLYPISEFVRHELRGKERTVELLLNPAATLNSIGDFVSSGDLGERLALGIEATGNRFDGIGVTSVIVRDTPSRSPYQYGSTLGLFFVAFVPRALWDEKPTINIGGWVTAVYGSGPHIRSATGPTQVGEFYFNFGWLGVVVLMALLGLLVRAAQESLFKSATAPALAAQVVIVIYLAIRFEASVAGVYSGMIFALTPIVLAHLVVRVLLKEGGARPSGGSLERLSASARGRAS